jgi:hypothetical protein
MRGPWRPPYPRKGRRGKAARGRGSASVAAGQRRGAGIRAGRGRVRFAAPGPRVGRADVVRRSASSEEVVGAAGGFKVRRGPGLREAPDFRVAGVVLGGQLRMPAAQRAGHARARVVGEVVAVGLPGLAGEPAGGDIGLQGGVGDAAVAARDVVRDRKVDEGLVGGMEVEWHGARDLGRGGWSQGAGTGLTERYTNGRCVPTARGAWAWRGGHGARVGGGVVRRSGLVVRRGADATRARGRRR